MTGYGWCSSVHSLWTVLYQVTEKDLLNFNHVSGTVPLLRRLYTVSCRTAHVCTWTDVSCYIKCIFVNETEWRLCVSHLEWQAPQIIVRGGGCRENSLTGHAACSPLLWWRPYTQTKCILKLFQRGRVDLTQKMPTCMLPFLFHPSFIFALCSAQGG